MNCQARLLVWPPGGAQWPLVATSVKRVLRTALIRVRAAVTGIERLLRVEAWQCLGLLGTTSASF
jgi:hypothetical protein